MKLSYVKFKALETFSDGTSSDEVTTDMHGEVSLDVENGIVHVGPDRFPLGHVRQYREMPSNCDICGNGFQDARALGAHKAHKHQIKGARNKGDE